MSSITLPSQSFQPAPPLGLGAAARALGVAITEVAALLRAALDAVMHRVNAMDRDAHANELRERALAHLATDPSFAADLLAAAERHQTVVEQA